MIANRETLFAIYEGWHTYQQLIVQSLSPLSETQLTFRLSNQLRSVDEIARHIIAARAYWFCRRMGEGDDEFEALGQWDDKEEKSRSAPELVGGLIRSWDIMQCTIARWSPTAWERTWQGKDPGTPKVITRHWVIWHLIEHDLHHGGEISLLLGAQGIQGVAP